MRISVAIDGPAGAGKSTIAKILADKLHLMYINTGSMYRVLTFRALEKNFGPEDVEELCSLIDSMEMRFQDDNLYVNDVDVSEYLSMPEISKHVSKYAAVNEVRQRLVKLQRKMSQDFNVIMDGRDIGTVVLKDATFKFYLTASPDERASRRYEELSLKGINVVYDEILREIIRRDFEDTHRDINPLTKAEDAVEIDTTGLTIGEVVEKLYKYIFDILRSLDKSN